MASINDVMGQTINYEVFVEGNRQLGTASVDLPEINFLTNEISGAGIAGKTEMPTLGHIENMELTLHWRSLFESPTRLLSQVSPMMQLRGLMQKYDAATGLFNRLPVRIDARVLATGLTMGKFEPAEQTETESKFNINYLKITIDGQKEVEIDILNYIFEVNGTDYLAPVRQGLGI